MTSCLEARGREFGDFEKAVSWDLTLGRVSPAGDLTVGDVGTVSIVKIVSLSPRVEKLKSRVNKRFVPEQRRVVSVSLFSMHMYILH